MGRYSLALIPDTEIALFHWSGPITLADRRENTRRMAQFCESHGVRRLIIDGRDQLSKTGTIDSFAFGKEVPSEMRGLIVAVVHRSDDKSLRFIETVASNRGSFTRSFLTIEEARAWLETFDDPSPRRRPVVSPD